jgi:membrane-associated phospholipid phosphatase
LWHRLRPGEWVLIAFFLYGVARTLLGPSGKLFLTAIPRLDLIGILLGVVTYRLGVEYRSKPWPADDTSSSATLHNVMLVPFVGTALVGGWIAFRKTTPPSYDEYGGFFAPLALRMAHFGFTALIAMSVVFFLWFSQGLRQKTGEALPLVMGKRLFAAIRDWLPVLGLIQAYGLMGAFLERAYVADQDVLLAQIDRWIFFGHDPTLLAEKIISPLLSEWAAACYVCYAFVYPLVLGAVYMLRPPKAFQEMTFVVCLTLGSGYILYTLVPAKGPIFTQTYSVSLNLYYTAWAKEQLMDATRIPRDCFPSLHTASSLVLLWGALRHVRKLGLILAPIIISIPFACVYLRYHYAIDVIAGAALALAVTTLAKRLRIWVPEPTVQPEPVALAPVAAPVLDEAPLVCPTPTRPPEKPE